MSENTISYSQKLSTILIAVLVAVSILIVWRTARTAKAMSASVSNDAQTAETAPGTVIKIVVEIEQMPGAGAIRGMLLNKRSEEIYSRSKVPVNLFYSSKVKIVMGKAADLHAGAIVHVTGKVREDHGLDAEQFVILTGYVKIE
jgi:hypothetical protein